MGAPRLARSRDYYDPTLHSYTSCFSVLFIRKMKFFILFRIKVNKKSLLRHERICGKW